MLLVENRLKQGIETPFGTSRYSVNFDESTSVAPSTPTVTWPPVLLVLVPVQLLVLLLEPASAYCAVAGGVATRKPMARSAVTINARFMGYLTK